MKLRVRQCPRLDSPLRTALLVRWLFFVPINEGIKKAQANHIHRTPIFQLQQKIFDRLCIAYRHSHEHPLSSLMAENLKRELAVPEAIWDEALDRFVDAAGERVVEVIVRNGKRYLKLGETAQSNLSDWAERANDGRQRYSEAPTRNQRRIVPGLQMIKR